MTKQNKPTAAELEILIVLWEKESATVREVFETINQCRQIVYTSILKTMQIMRGKNLVARDDSNKAHVFRAVESQFDTQKNLSDDLIDKVFDGSALNLFQHVLESNQMSMKELKKIRKMTKKVEKKLDLK